MIKKIISLFSKKKDEVVATQLSPVAAPPIPVVQQININNTGNGTVIVNNLPSRIVLNPYERVTGLFLRTTIENTSMEDQKKVRRKIWEIKDHEVFMVQVDNVVSLIKKPGQVEQLVPVSGSTVNHSSVSVTYILGKMFGVRMEEILDEPDMFFISLINRKIEIVEIPQERFEKILSMV